MRAHKKKDYTSRYTTPCLGGGQASSAFIWWSSDPLGNNGEAVVGQFIWAAGCSSCRATRNGHMQSIVSCTFYVGSMKLCSILSWCPVITHQARWCTDQNTVVSLKVQPLQLVWANA